MDVARLRALTRYIFISKNLSFLRRNGCSPIEGINTQNIHSCDSLQRVEMDVARLRALTHYTKKFQPLLDISRNGCSLIGFSDEEMQDRKFYIYFVEKMRRENNTFFIESMKWLQFFCL